MSTVWITATFGYTIGGAVVVLYALWRMFHPTR
jgi:hypothetical protein